LASLPKPRRPKPPPPSTRAHAAFLAWREVPAPRRGELVRLLGEELRAAKADLGRLVTLEAGKVVSEGLGEVQEMIDICDYAVGLSRQLFGLTIATERPSHRMMETWHPLGVVGVISAFNFPVAVWSWNAALAFVCGDAVVWKPSEKTPLTALAVQALFERAAGRFGADAPAGLSTLLIGGRETARPWWTTPRSPWFPPPARRPWAGRWAQGSPSVSPAPCWSWAATTPPSSPPAPTWTWPCAASPSRPWARPASAAPPCAVSSCMRMSTRPSSAG
jgi:aldehyde dehydrogenase (NAD+)